MGDVVRVKSIGSNGHPEWTTHKGRGFIVTKTDYLEIISDATIAPHIVYAPGHWIAVEEAEE